MVTARTSMFFGLNAVRVLSIVGLLLVFASSILVMVTNIKAVNHLQAMRTSANSTEAAEAEKYLEDCDYIHGSTVPNQAAGVFWAVVSGLLILFQTVILILSEVGWPSTFFDRFFPVLGSNFGVGALGIFQCLIGAQILSHFVDGFTLVAAFFLFAMGCVNILVGLIFRESVKERRCISIWQHGSKPILPTTKDMGPVFINASPAFTAPTFIRDPMSRSGSTDSFDSFDEKMMYGFGRQGEKAAGLKGFYLQRPEESLPRYASPSPAPSSYQSHSAPSTAPSTPPTNTVELPKTQPLSITVAPTNKSAALASALSRNKSVRTSTSSFASPDDYNTGAYHSDNEFYATEDEDDSVYAISRPASPMTPPGLPIPTFIASPHEVPVSGYGSRSRSASPPTFKSSPTAF